MAKSAIPSTRRAVFAPAKQLRRPAFAFLTWCRAAFSLCIIITIFISSGCSGKKTYEPAEEVNGNKIVLVNTIYNPGFYVELDGQETGFLKDRLEIGITPGKHKLKIYNNESEVGETPTTIEHKFNLKVDIGQREVQEIHLRWDDPNYSRDTKREPLNTREENQKKQRSKPERMPQ